MFKKIAKIFAAHKAASIITSIILVLAIGTGITLGIVNNKKTEPEVFKPYSPDEQYEDVETYDVDPIDGNAESNSKDTKNDESSKSNKSEKSDSSKAASTVETKKSNSNKSTSSKSNSSNKSNSSSKTSSSSGSSSNKNNTSSSKTNTGSSSSSQGSNSGSSGSSSSSGSLSSGSGAGSSTSGGSTSSGNTSNTEAQVGKYDNDTKSWLYPNPIYDTTIGTQIGAYVGAYGLHYAPGIFGSLEERDAYNKYLHDTDPAHFDQYGNQTHCLVCNRPVGDGHNGTCMRISTGQYDENWHVIHKCINYD